MIRILHEGGDFHSTVATEIFSEVARAVELGEVIVDERCRTPFNRDVPLVKERFEQQRGQAKAVVFAILYGKQEQSLSEDLDISQSEAQELINNFLKRKPAVRSWKLAVLAEARSKTRVRSLL